MTIDEARVRLQKVGFVVTEEKRLPNETGTQLKINGPGFSGVSVSVYDKGTYYVQGNNKSQVDDALSQTSKANFTTSGSQTSSPNSLVISLSPGTTPDLGPTEPEQNRIFVVHGHDNEVRTELQLALLQLGLEPFVLTNTSGGSLTIIEALEKEIGPGADRIRFGIVLLTPDDMGYLSADGPKKSEASR